MRREEGSVRVAKKRSDNNSAKLFCSFFFEIIFGKISSAIINFLIENNISQPTGRNKRSEDLP